MKKIFAILAVVSILGVVLTGCGSKEGEGSTGTTGTTGSTATGSTTTGS